MNELIKFLNLSLFLKCDQVFLTFVFEKRKKKKERKKKKIRLTDSSFFSACVDKQTFFCLTSLLTPFPIGLCLLTPFPIGLGLLTPFPIGLYHEMFTWFYLNLCMLTECGSWPVTESTLWCKWPWFNPYSWAYHLVYICVPDLSIAASVLNVWQVQWITKTPQSVLFRVM